MQDEITPGLKNAIERGESIENAVQSFINAGYNPVEVRSAASSLTQGATSIASTVQFNLPRPLREADQFYAPPQQYQQKPASKTLLVVVILILLLFVAGLITAAFFFGDQILEFIAG